MATKGSMTGKQFSDLLNRFNGVGVLTDRELWQLKYQLEHLKEFLIAQDLRPLAFYYHHTIESIERMQEARKEK